MQTTELQDLKEQARMLREALLYAASEGTLDLDDKRVQVLVRYEARIAELVASGSDGLVTSVPDGSGTGTPRNLTDRPAAGSAASNQYGTFTVHYASEKQTAFIKSLMDRKDLSKLENSVILDVARLREQVANLQVNKKAASAIIDRLLALPDLANAPAAAPRNLASDKQLAFIQKLADERDWLSIGVDERAKVEYVRGGGRPTSKGASELIEHLLATVKKEIVVEAGVYVNPDGSVYRVYLGQQSGRMLAAKVVDSEFVYAGQADRFVTSASRKMTVEEAAAWGKATGTCIVCARRLDVPESVDRGIGPVCFAKMGG